MALDSAWYAERIQARKDEIVATEAAILALVQGSQSYTLDTGQSRQTVTKANLTELRKSLEWLEGELDRLCTKAEDVAAGNTGSGSQVVLKPSF